MKLGIKHAPFTMPQGHYPRMIVSPVEVMNPKAGLPGSIVKMKLTAQWDTGADFCMISSALARNLRLESFGEASVNHVAGNDLRRNTYLVNLFLPNGIYFEDVLTVEDEGLKETGIDFLIGLAVINELDFALTHEKDGTVLSISYPDDRLVVFCENN